MRYRKLRIAWSVAWGIACLLLIVLWVRSYWWIDEAAGPTPDGHALLLSSSNGALEFGRQPNTQKDWPGWTFVHTSAKFIPWQWQRSGSRFQWQSSAIGIYGRVPWWFPVVCGAVFSLLPWVGKARFTLRTLLIATTLVAVVLRLIAWLR
jgi:hypothetical protein